MSQSQQKNTAAIFEKAMTMQQAGNMSTDQIRGTVSLYTKRNSKDVFALTTDTKMSIGQKTVLSLPALNKRDLATQIVSINMVKHKGTAIPVVTYIGEMTSEISKVVTMLAPTCASIRGGYFPGLASLSETKTQVGGIAAPSHFRNIVALNEENSLLFSTSKTLQKISVADFLKQNWSAAKVVNQLSSEILFIGRPSENEKSVFVVTEATIFTVNVENKTWSQVEKQPAPVSEKVLAFFKDGKSLISMLNNGSIQMSTVAA